MLGQIYRGTRAAARVVWYLPTYVRALAGLPWAMLELQAEMMELERRVRSDLHDVRTEVEASSPGVQAYPPRGSTYLQ